MPDISFKSFLNGSQAHVKLELAAYPVGLFADPSPSLPLAADDRGPLSWIMGGRMQPSTLSAAKPVILMASRDAYPRIDEADSRLRNPDVDTLWQMYFQAQRNNPALNALSCQVDQNGYLLPFQPLFLCRRARRFFEPPCPRCGRALELCREDARLAAHGLQGYSTSLRRYLFCPSCAQDTPVFYAAQPEAGSTVQGPDMLIREFGRLSAGDLPCIGCNEHARCYGNERQALLSITPVVFYPFHLLIFEAAALNAVTYLGLAAGTPLAELGQDLFTLRSPMEGPVAEGAAAPPPVVSEKPPLVTQVSATPGTGTSAQNDASIRQIIQDIRTRWTAAAETQGKTVPPEATTGPSAVVSPIVEQAAEKTDSAKDSAARVSREAAPQLQPEEEDFHTETIIVRHAPPPEETPLQPEPTEALEQTVLLKPAVRPTSKAAAQPPPPAHMDATVVIAPPAPAPSSVPPQAMEPTEAPAKAPSPPQDDLMETVIMGAPAKATKTPAADDELAETVILKPKK